MRKHNLLYIGMFVLEMGSVALAHQNAVTLDDMFDKLDLAKQTQALFLGEVHAIGAGRLRYDRLLEKIYQHYPFDCIVFEEQPGVNSAEQKRQIDNMNNGPLTKEAYLAFEDMAEQNVEYFKGSRSATLKSRFDPETISILAFGVFLQSSWSKGRAIRWWHVDDKRNKTNTWDNVNSRNIAIAEKLSEMLEGDHPECKKILSINGRAHLSSNFIDIEDLKGNKDNRNQKIELVKKSIPSLLKDKGIGVKAIELIDFSNLIPIFGESEIKYDPALITTDGQSIYTSKSSKMMTRVTVGSFNELYWLYTYVSKQPEYSPFIEVKKTTSGTGDTTTFMHGSREDLDATIIVDF